MDNNSSEYIIESINAKLASVTSSIENKLVRLNGGQEAFQKNIENILEEKFDKLNIDIKGNIDSSIIVQGSNNIVYFNSNIKLKDILDKINLPDKTIREVYYNLNEYIISKEIKYLKEARRLWLQEFIHQIDSLSETAIFQDVLKANQIINNFSSKHHTDVTTSIIEGNINFEDLKKILLKIVQIKHDLAVLKSLFEKYRK